jgi:predicted ferric reductase
MGSLLPPELLSQVLRWSLHAHEEGAISAAEGGFGDGLKNPANRKLIEQILFTRRFAPTYLAVLGLVVLLFSAGHLWTRVRQWRNGGSHSNAEQLLQSDTPSSSSSSSTLQGTASPPEVSTKVNINETTPLLAKADLPAQFHTSILGRLQCNILSTLAYQPRPIFALTSPINVLPQNGTSGLILVLLGLNLFYLFYCTPLSIPMLFVFADRAGLLFVVNLPVLYVLAAKCNQPLKLLTGWSYEGLNIFHRRLGEWMIILGVLHSVGMFGVWYTLLRPLHFSLLRFLSTRLVLLGISTLVSYLAIWVKSTGLFRKLYYETFLGLHIVLQVSALVLLFFHHPGARIYVLGSLGIWASDRILGRIFISSKRFVATLYISEDGETILLICDIPIRPGVLGSNVHISNGWEAGQHVFVTIPGIGRQHRLQAHPFTIASSAPPSKHLGAWSLQLTIRAQDGFSRELLEYAELHQHTEVLLDGPYGSLDTLKALKTADRTCFIAGGSGIAVTYPLAWSVLVPDSPDSVASTRVIYRNGQKHVPCVRASESVASGRYAHFWVRQLYKQHTWITIFPRADAMGAAPQENSKDITDGIDLVTKHFFTQEVASHERPDVGLELRRWVEDGHESGKADRVCVVVSGPDGLVRDVRNTAARLLRDGWDIDVFVEKFGW